MQNTKAGSIETHVRTCSLMHTYVSAFTYIRVSTCLPTLQKNPLPFPCTVSPAVSLTVSPAVSPAESCAEFSQNSALYIILIYYIYSPKEIPPSGRNHPDGYIFALQNLQLELLIQQLNLLNRQLNLQLFFILRSQTSGPMPADESVFA